MRKESKFSLVVSGLTDYIYENQDILLAKTLFSPKTAELIQSEGTVLTGVKNVEKLGLMTTDAIFQDGTGCTRTSSGATTLTQRAVTVGTISVVEDICAPDLEKKYIGFKMKGANANHIPFEADFANYKTQQVAKQLEIDLWQGDTASAFGQIKYFDGLIKLIDAGSPVLSNVTTFTSVAGLGANGAITQGIGISTTNVKNVVDSLWRALPSDIMGQDDVRIFCGWDVFNTFISAYRDQNLFNFAPTGKEVMVNSGEVIIPGTTYKLTAVHGLDGTNRLFGIRMSNLFLGTDLEHDYEEFAAIEDQFHVYVRLQMRFRMGVQVAFPDQVTSFKMP